MRNTPLLPFRPQARCGARRLLAVPLALLGLALAACGGGGGAGPAAAMAGAGLESPAGSAPAVPVVPPVPVGSEPTTMPGPVAAPPAATPASAPAVTAVPVLTIRARGDLAAGVGPVMQLRVDGTVVGTVEVRDAAFTDYPFPVPGLRTGAVVDLVYVNDAVVNGQDRNLHIASLADAMRTVLPTSSLATVDRGTDAAAFDGLDTLPGRSDLTSNGALRLTWPAPPAADPLLSRKMEASRFLQQASFGPTPATVERLAGLSVSAWLDEQMALPASPDFVNHVQSRYDLGDDYRPRGSKYSPSWTGQKFWATAATGPDQLRKRTAYALHHIFMVSQADAALYHHVRAYAHYLDTLNKHAFGNFRDLLEEMALSPAMGIYLSHMRNRKEDPASGRSPDENFAREVMQLFTIGLHELNNDGSLKLDAKGKPIETYGNDDVMALARVFTGWSWALADHQLSEGHFLYGWPDTSVANDQRADVRRMRAYPGLHSSSQKRLFAGKPQAVTIAANASASEGLRIALDALAAHPNVGPFIGRQLIQRLTTSHPSLAYVGRVAAAFNNNGKGVRGDLGAVVRAVLLDTEARSATAADLGSLREPVLRVTHWMRAFGATSVSGQFTMAAELENVSQRAMAAPSVFGYFRPGYVPPNTRFSQLGATAPEFQIVNESTTAAWVNTAITMVGIGLGGTGTGQDVVANYDAQAALAAAGDGLALVQNLNLLLFAGQMSAALQRDLLDAMGGVAGSGTTSQVNRAKVAVLLALVSPEYLSMR